MSQTTIPTSLQVAIAGQLADTNDNMTVVGVSGEASAEIPFGVMVCKGSTDDAHILVAASTAKLTGVLVHQHTYDNGPNGSLGTTGLKPKAVFDVLRQGTIYVLVEEAVVAQDRAFVRYAAGAGGTVLGAFRKTAVSSETIDVGTKCQFLTSAASGGYAVLHVDMLNS